MTQSDNAPASVEPADDEPASGDGAAGLGFLFGVVLDGRGGARPISWDAAQAWRPEGETEVLWLHLDRTHPEVTTYLEDQLELAPATVEVLVSNETRPRAYREQDAIVTILRGINLNPGAEPRDMIAMQIWADSTRVVSLRRRRLQSPRDVLAMLERNNGPKTSGDLLTELIEQMVAKMNRTIVDINEQIDELEATDPERNISSLLDAIAKIRRYCLALKRYMTPQHDALLQLGRDLPAWMSGDNARDIHEVGERLRRYLDDLDVSKESAIVLQDDLNNRATERANRTMYMLSLVAAIFLPLGFLTGLLGINVGGMPGVNSSHAFWITVGLLAAVLAAQVVIFKKLRWL